MFRFKQFNIEDYGATMKVGTDAVLLGVLTKSGLSEEERPLNILDVGTGCGVVALILAQCFPMAKIDAIDIDEESVSVAKENFANSSWNSRLTVYNAAFQYFRNDEDFDGYDIIVSNPPYFSNSLRNSDKRKMLARHDDRLSLTELFENAGRLLKKNGRLTIILPETELVRAITIGEGKEFFCQNSVEIRNHHEDVTKLRVITFVIGNYELVPENRVVCLRDSGNDYSKQYRELTKDFYLWEK